jgi:hypothetical protein
MELWIANDFSGVQKGTKENPYSVRTAAEYDALLTSFLYDEDHWFRRGLELHFGDGDFYTAGCYEFGTQAIRDRPRIGPDWKVYGSGHTTINLDPTAVTDSYLTDAPLRIFSSAGTWQQYLWWGREQEWVDLPPEEVWRQLSVKQIVRDIHFNLNYSKFIDRWKAFNLKFSPSAGLLQGHGPAWENAHVSDFGAYHILDAQGKPVPGAEAFPLALAGAVDGYDRNKIAKLDPTKYIFDANFSKAGSAHHTGCTFDKFNEADSNDQVSMCTIVASIGQPGASALTADDGSAYIHHFRKWSYQTHNPLSDFSNTKADRNQLQGFTLYQVLGGEIAYNGGANIQAGAYQDFYKTYNVDVHDNAWKEVLRGVCFLLSPTGPDDLHFESKGHTVRRNNITLLSSDADWHAGVLLWNFPYDKPNTRLLGDITIGGKGEENDISVVGRIGAGNRAVKAVGVTGLTIGANKLDKRYSKPFEITESTNVVQPKRPNIFRRLGAFITRNPRLTWS